MFDYRLPACFASKTVHGHEDPVEASPAGRPLATISVKLTLLNQAEEAQV
jgi:hypothetical protein